MTCREEVDFRMCSNHPTEAASVLRLLVTDMIGRLGDSQTIVLSFEALFRVSIHRVGNFEGGIENTCMEVRLFKSQTLTVLSSPTESIRSGAWSAITVMNIVIRDGLSKWTE